jgi:nucleoid DNA-binding protein
MVKVDIVRAIQLGTHLQFGEAEKLVNDMLDMIKDKLEKGEDVLITPKPLLPSFEVNLISFSSGFFTLICNENPELFPRGQ